MKLQASKLRPVFIKAHKGSFRCYWRKMSSWSARWLGSSCSGRDKDSLPIDKIDLIWSPPNQSLLRKLDRHRPVQRHQQVRPQQRVSRPLEAFQLDRGQGQLGWSQARCCWNGGDDNDVDNNNVDDDNVDNHPQGSFKQQGRLWPGQESGNRRIQGRRKEPQERDRLLQQERPVGVRRLPQRQQRQRRQRHQRHQRQPKSFKQRHKLNPLYSQDIEWHKRQQQRQRQDSERAQPRLRPELPAGRMPEAGATGQRKNNWFIMDRD